MTLQQLRDFVAVVNHGGFRAAARALDVSQGGLTKSLAKFEDEHGIPLIERKAKGVVLTAHGEEFFQQAQALLKEADRAEEWLRTARGRPAVSITLGVSIEPSLKFVPAVLVDFRRMLPGVTLNLTQSVASELLAGLRENRLEFAVTRLPLQADLSDMHVDVLCESESVILGRTGHPCARVRSIAQLVDQDWVVLRHHAGPGTVDDSVRELFEERQLPAPRIAATTDSLFGALAILVQSDCLARLPRAVLNHPLTARLLAAVPLEDPPRRYRIALVHKASQRLGREAQSLAAMLSSFARISRALS